MTDQPHFGIPFQFARARGGIKYVPVTEQDSIQEIGDCVELILRTVQGQRQTIPEFGRPETLEFTADRELARVQTQAAVDLSEPRVQTVIYAPPVDPADQGLLRLMAMYDHVEETP